MTTKNADNSNEAQLYSAAKSIAATHSSAIPKYYELTVDHRQDVAGIYANLTDNEVQILRNTFLNAEEKGRENNNIENCIAKGVGLGTYFRINGKNYLIPMRTEEQSVIGAASNGAKKALIHGGFKASAMASIMSGHIQLVDIPDRDKAITAIREHAVELLELANSVDPKLVAAGGGAKSIEGKIVNTAHYEMMAVEIKVDCKDAMGANAVNKMAEAIAPRVSEITGAEYIVRIISNLAKDRLARATATFDKDDIAYRDPKHPETTLLTGSVVVERMIKAYEFADAYIERGLTHNKGIMNGIDAAGAALMQDTRALECAHGYAAYGHPYGSLTKYSVDQNGNLATSIELPIAVGIVGGVVNLDPLGKVLLKIVDVHSAQELAGTIAAVGLAQNFAAVYALATEGIVRGHNTLLVKAQSGINLRKP